MNNVLQDLYDSEINFSISCFWDAGFEVKLGDDAIGFCSVADSVYGMENVYAFLKSEAIKYYPNSDFAKKYNKKEKK